MNKILIPPSSYYRTSGMVTLLPRQGNGIITGPAGVQIILNNCQEGETHDIDKENRKRIHLLKNRRRHLSYRGTFRVLKLPTPTDISDKNTIATAYTMNKVPGIDSTTRNVPKKIRYTFNDDSDVIQDIIDPTGPDKSHRTHQRSIRKGCRQPNILLREVIDQLC